MTAQRTYLRGRKGAAMSEHGDDWSEAFDDKDEADWEREFAGPDDADIEAQSNYSSDDSEPIYPLNEGYAVRPVVTAPEINTQETLKSAVALAFSNAMRSEDLTLFRSMLDTGLSVDTPLDGNRTALMYALYRDNVELTKLCLDYGAWVWAVDDVQYSVIREALISDTESGHVVTLRALQSSVELIEKNDVENDGYNTAEYRVCTGEEYDPKADPCDEPNPFTDNYIQRLTPFPLLMMLIEFGQESLFERALTCGVDVFGQRTPEADPEFDDVYPDMVAGCDVGPKSPYKRYDFLRSYDPLMLAIYHYKQYRMGWLLNEKRKFRLRSQDSFITSLTKETIEHLQTICETNEKKLRGFFSDARESLPEVSQTMLGSTPPEKSIDQKPDQTAGSKHSKLLEELNYYLRMTCDGVDILIENALLRAIEETSRGIHNKSQIGVLVAARKKYGEMPNQKAPH